MIFGRNIQMSLEKSVCFSFHVGLLFLLTFRPSNQTPNITRILTLYQANATTLTLFSKGDKILIKNLYECKGYNA